ncbi:GNAT family N-acetyltransferase [Microbacterium sp. USTB-Y]|uniref:GNAT family N-acetyltransferase n=1 Tax=Microbacterium sp. USTB-Y TaxID=2823692 RepID=UPI00203C8366|nr:GNAT family N-acetyltransferase [Microbacterium sp. USTB-Y]
MSTDFPLEITTDRLLLRRPVPDDLADVFAVNADPRVWTHFPSLRPTAPEQIGTMMERWWRSWERAGLGSWTVRLRETGQTIGNGGCTLLASDPDDPAARVWNLGYRLSADHHGHGYATELARAARAAAAEVMPEVPVIAFLVEHNRPSAAVAEKAGLSLVHRASDAGNPDPAVMRLVYADRPLSAVQLATALR